MCKTVVRSALPFFLLLFFWGGGGGGGHGIPAIVITRIFVLSVNIFNYCVYYAVTLFRFSTL